MVVSVMAEVMDGFDYALGRSYLEIGVREVVFGRLAGFYA